MNFFKTLRFTFFGKAHGLGPAYDAYRRKMLHPALDPAAPRPYRCKGGPFDHHAIYLHSPDTLSFSGGRYELADKPGEVVWREG